MKSASLSCEIIDILDDDDDDDSGGGDQDTTSCPLANRTASLSSCNAASVQDDENKEIIVLCNDDDNDDNTKNYDNTIILMTTPPSGRKRAAALVTVSQSKEEKQRRKKILGHSNNNNNDEYSSRVTTPNTSNSRASITASSASGASLLLSSKEKHAPMMITNNGNGTAAATTTKTTTVSGTVSTTLTINNKQRFRFEKRATASAASCCESSKSLPPLLSQRVKKNLRQTKQITMPKNSNNNSNNNEPNHRRTIVIRKGATHPPKLFDLSSSSSNLLQPQDYLKTKEQQTLYLAKDIDNDADRNLQRLLWSIGCRYNLMSYQFAGVRGVTGVEKDYPQNQINNKQKVKSSDDSAATISMNKDWNQILRDTHYNKDDSGQGLLLADSMGLGKTVQAVCATMLRNAIADAQGKPPLPTVLVSPNHAVGMQWAETLVKAGVDAGTIYQFTPKKRNHYEYEIGAIYILLTRYELQSEMKYLLNLAKQEPPNNSQPPRDNTNNNNSSRRRHHHHHHPPVPLLYSPLFPHAPNNLLVKLSNQYESQQRARVKNRYRNPKESPSACATRLLKESITKDNNNNNELQQPAFRTVVIDEAHFLKNLLAFWGLGASLLGLHGERTIPMSGTPMNNGPQDMATLMTFIDPNMDAALEDWWKKATSSRTSTAAAVRQSVAECLDRCMLRRSKKLLEGKLPPKTVVMKEVSPVPLELHVYEQYEQSFLLTLDQFTQMSMEHTASSSSEYMRKKKELFEMMMALSSCMRMSLIHPALPGGGRDWAINFSPSRRDLFSEKLCDENRCVVCKAIDKKKRAEQKKKTKQKGFTQADHRRATTDAAADADALENLQDDQLQGDDNDTTTDMLLFDNDCIIHGGNNKMIKIDYHEIVDKGNIIEIPPEHCWLPNIRNNKGRGGLRHYAHEKCLDFISSLSSSNDGPVCPLCADLKSRAHLQSGKNALLDMKKEAEKLQGVKQDENNTNIIGRPLDNNNLEINRPLYCQGVVPGLEEGFMATAKIDSVLSDLKNKTTQDDKIIMLSFFKGSLDLLEGAIVHDLGIDCARFDGDVPPETRQMELNRFKQDPNCRVLLMTVQTGGTGLNIVEANRCEFIDRWFNPFVHDQAEDRLHRLGQKRPVTVTYHDTNYTVDIAMRRINEIKTRNAEILLADGSSLTMASAGLSYKEMAGELGISVRAVRAARIQGISNPANYPDGDFSRLMPQQTAASIFEHLEQGIKNAGGKPQFNTVCDVLAHLLGYVPKAADTKPSASTAASSNNKEVKPETHLKRDSPSSTLDEELMATKATCPSFKRKTAEAANVTSLIDADSSDDEDFTGAPTFAKKEQK